MSALLESARRQVHHQAAEAMRGLDTLRPLFAAAEILEHRLREAGFQAVATAHQDGGEWLPVVNVITDGSTTPSGAVADLLDDWAVPVQVQDVHCRYGTSTHIYIATVAGRDVVLTVHRRLPLMTEAPTLRVAA